MVRSVPQGGNWKDIPISVAKKSRRVMNIRKSGGRTTYYGRLREDQPAYTINTYFNRPGNGTFIHPKFDRLISIREAARLQSFPDTYRFLGSTSSMFKQVGNAVPPLLSRALGSIIPSGRAVDLFAGCGGLSEGLVESGHEVIVAADNNSHMCDTYRHNHNNTEVLTSDLRNPDEFTRLVETIENKLNGRTLNLLAGGPPCQGYSTAGNWNSNDPRNGLIHVMFEAVRIFEPEWVLIENVPGIKWMNNGEILKSLMTKMNSLHYSVAVFTLHAEKYCVPQRRRRIFIIGNRSRNEIQKPSSLTAGISHSKNRNNPEYTTELLPYPVTVEEAISDLTYVNPSKSLHEVVYEPEWLESNYQLLMRQAITLDQFIDNRAEQH